MSEVGRREVLVGDEIEVTDFPDADVLVVGPDDRLVLLFGDRLDAELTEALIESLKSRGLWERTVVVSGSVRVGVLRG